MKLVIALVVGLGCGYYFGSQDGIAKKPSIVNRIVDKAGGKARSAVRNDIDAEMRRAEDTARPPLKPMPR